MLQYIRSNVQGVMAKIIVAIIVVPFAIFGIESLVHDGGESPAATVNGEKIAQGDLQRAIRQQQQRLLSVMGENVDPAMLDESRLRQPALDGLITQQLLSQQAKSLGLSISDAGVDQLLTSLPQFQQDGKFAPERYVAVLRESGYAPADFKQRARADLEVDQLYTGLALSEFVTRAELERIVALSRQQRSFDYVVVPVTRKLDDIVVSNDDIESYYQARADTFLQPERVKLEYIELKAADFAKPVDEVAIVAEYEREKQNAGAGVERHAAHILIEISDKRDEAAAQVLATQVADELATGGDFTALAARYSDDFGSKQSGGDLGVTHGETFPEPFEQALATLKPGEVSAPVRTDAGFHLVKLLDQRVEAVLPLEQRRAEIGERLAAQAAQPELLKAVEQLRDLAFNADGLQQPARAMKLAVRSSDWLERNNRDPLFSNPKLIGAAFADEVLKERNNSDAIELAPGHFVVLRVAEHAKAAPRPLADVKAEVTTLLQRERAVTQAHARAEALKQSLLGGTELSVAASKEGLEVKQGKLLQRSAADIDGEVLRAAFALPRAGDAAAQTALTDTATGDVALIRLREAVDGKLADVDQPQQRMLAAQLRRGNGDAVFAAYLDAVRVAADIETP